MPFARTARTWRSWSASLSIEVGELRNGEFRRRLLQFLDSGLGDFRLSMKIDRLQVLHSREMPDSCIGDFEGAIAHVEKLQLFEVGQAAKMFIRDPLPAIEFQRPEL